MIEQILIWLGYTGLQISPDVIILVILFSCLVPFICLFILFLSMKNGNLRSSLAFVGIPLIFSLVFFEVSFSKSISKCENIPAQLVWQYAGINNTIDTTKLVCRFRAVGETEYNLVP
jgi:uncharacterized membrane protein YjfL (UPF0719 family)